MSRLRVAPIVEGHGEVQAVRILLQRTWTEVLGGSYLDVIRPIRRTRTQLVQKAELQKAVEFAHAKLTASTPSPDPALILVLLDADDDLPCLLGPQLLADARAARPDADVTCVLANLEYETWFVAAAESLRDYLLLGPNERVPDDPEQQRTKKTWIEAHFKGNAYSSNVDMPAMTARMDLQLCRKRSRSYDKLCRELERRLGHSVTTDSDPPGA